jgi:hypothetical protein
MDTYKHLKPVKQTCIRADLPPEAMSQWLCVMLRWRRKQKALKNPGE